MTTSPRVWLNRIIAERMKSQPASDPPTTPMQLQRVLISYGFNPLPARLIACVTGVDGLSQPIETILYHALNHLSELQVEAGEYPSEGFTEDQWTDSVWSQERVDGLEQGNLRIFHFNRNSDQLDFPKLKTVEKQLKALLGGHAKLWYHATSWKSATDIAVNGPDLGLCTRPTEFGSKGCFYLNPCIADAYTWFLANRSALFHGLCGMVVYACEATDLHKDGGDFGCPDSSDGWTPLMRREWSHLVKCCVIDEGELSEGRKTRDMHWIVGPQVAATRDVKARKDPAPRLSDASLPMHTTAMQLGVRTQESLDTLHSKLVGVIFFRNRTPASASASESTAQVTFTPADAAADLAAALAVAALSPSHSDAALDSAPASSNSCSSSPPAPVVSNPESFIMHSRSGASTSESAASSLLVCVEYPGFVQSIPNALKQCKGEDSIRKVRNTQRASTAVAVRSAQQLTVALLLCVPCSFFRFLPQPLLCRPILC